MHAQARRRPPSCLLSKKGGTINQAASNTLGLKRKIRKIGMEEVDPPLAGARAGC